MLVKLTSEHIKIANKKTERKGKLRDTKKKDIKIATKVLVNKKT